MLFLDILLIAGTFIDIIKYFVEKLIKTSKDLGMQIVAEFVENKEIAQILMDLKVDAMQGNFYGAASIIRLTKYSS